MRFQHTLVDFGDLDSMAEDTEESEAFKAKFVPKKTTDDVYTPGPVYDAVAKWVFAKYGLAEDTLIVRPFYPGGDYRTHDYPKDCLVLDNPPFSIMHEIVRFYVRHGVRFFLFANALTLFRQIELCNAVVAGVDVTFTNGAKISISFLTSLGDNRIEVAGDLATTIKDADKSRPKIVHQDYEFPPNVTTGARLSVISNAGLCLSIRDAIPVVHLDPDYQIFGGGVLISDETAQREAAQREAAQRDRIKLSLTVKDAERLAVLNGVSYIPASDVRNLDSYMVEGGAERWHRTVLCIPTWGCSGATGAERASSSMRWPRIRSVGGTVPGAGRPWTPYGMAGGISDVPGSSDLCTVVGSRPPGPLCHHTVPDGPSGGMVAPYQESRNLDPGGRDGYRRECRVLRRRCRRQTVEGVGIGVRISAAPSRMGTGDTHRIPAGIRE